MCRSLLCTINRIHTKLGNIRFRLMGELAPAVLQVSRSRPTLTNLSNSVLKQTPFDALLMKTPIRESVASSYQCGYNFQQESHEDETKVMVQRRIIAGYLLLRCFLGLAQATTSRVDDVETHLESSNVRLQAMSPSHNPLLSLLVITHTLSSCPADSRIQKSCYRWIRFD